MYQELVDLLKKSQLNEFSNIDDIATIDAQGKIQYKNGCSYNQILFKFMNIIPSESTGRALTNNHNGILFCVDNGLYFVSDGTFNIKSHLNQDEIDSIGIKRNTLNICNLIEFQYCKEISCKEAKEIIKEYL